MSSFTSQLYVTPLDATLWQLLDGFEYRAEGDLDEYGTGTESDVGTFIITVPAGFVTDFASVPRPLWWLFPPWGTYGKAAVVHDFLYSVKRFTRGVCDRIFLDAMKELGVSWRTRTVMYAAVRACGWLAWNKKGPAAVAATSRQDVTLAKDGGSIVRV